MLKNLRVAEFCLAARRYPSVALCVALCALIPARTARAQHPHIVSFDAPGALATVPDGPTPTGTIVGFYLDGNFVAHGFLRSPNGEFTAFDAPGAGTMTNNPVPGVFAGTFPLGINPFGMVVGYYNDDNLVSHCFIRTADGTITTFDAPGADTKPADQAGSQLTGINPLGTTVGLYIGSNFIGHGFLRSPSGHFTSFDAAPGSVFTFPNGPINLEGTLVGFYEDAAPRFHAFVRDPDGKLTFFDPPGAGDTGPYQGTIFSYNFTPDGNEVAGLNDLGAVAATYLDANNVYHGFLRSPDGKFTSFDAPGADTTGDLNGTFPFVINDLGVIVGIYTDTNFLPHGFIRQP
jgi:hypothetical protein